MHGLVENVGNILQNTIQFFFNNSNNKKKKVHSWFPITETVQTKRHLMLLQSDCLRR